MRADPQPPTKLNSMRKLFRILAFAVAMSGLTGAALAHPALLGGQPGPNAVVSARPRELRLTFSEPLFINFSGVEITNARGAKLPLGRPTLARGDGKVLVVHLKTALPAGVYTVSWHAVSADTHRITGSYRFTVR